MKNSELQQAIAAHTAANNVWDTTQVLLDALIKSMRAGGFTRQEFQGSDFKVVFTLKKQKQ